MTDDRKLDLVVLAALGALDGDDRARFEALVVREPELQREVAAYRELVGRIGVATTPVPPPAALRERLLRETRPALAAPPSWLAPALAAALLAALGGVVLLLGQREAARREAAFEREAAREARQVAQKAQAEAALLREALAIGVAFQELVIRPQSQMVSLSGLAAAPRANARLVWNAERREAVLLASSLEPAPRGKAYELWIIAKAAPRPAGVFQADVQGRVVFRLPAGLDFLGVKTFAVTLEPEGGVPAPTGPMVLAGAVS
jgi:anti-sigma-K factor RskA